MVEIKNNMTSEEVNDLIKKYEYLVKSNLQKHFFVYANKNDCYFDILQAGLMGLWYGIKNYKDRDFDNEYSFKCYLSRCAYSKMSDFTKLHKHKKEDCKSLIDVVNTDMEGNKLTIEDLYETFDDTTDVIANEIIDFYTGVYREIMILLSKGYKLREVSRELGISYSKLNNVYMPEIRENLNIRYGIKRSTPYYCDKKIKCIGVEFEYENVFNDLNEASEVMGIDPNSIRKIAQKIRKRAKAKNFGNKKVTFEYV